MGSDLHQNEGAKKETSEKSKKYKVIKQIVFVWSSLSFVSIQVFNHEVHNRDNYLYHHYHVYISLIGIRGCVAGPDPSGFEKAFGSGISRGSFRIRSSGCWADMRGILGWDHS